ncbi:hypothetical protein O9992_14170 [Vibrio lentus]|nr:hypothetical protein [Vibrio lentus]
MSKAVRQVLSICRKNQDLVSIGAYKPGTDPAIDSAFTLKPRLDEYLQQKMKNSTLRHVRQHVEACGELGRVE